MPDTTYKVTIRVINFLFCQLLYPDFALLFGRHDMRGTRSFLDMDRVRCTGNGFVRGGSIRLLLEMGAVVEKKRRQPVLDTVGGHMGLINVEVFTSDILQKRTDRFGLVELSRKRSFIAQRNQSLVSLQKQVHPCHSEKDPFVIIDSGMWRAG